MSGYVNHDRINILSVTGPYQPAQYRAILPHWVAGQRYMVTNTIMTEGHEIPFGWVPPTLAVDPLNATAVNNFYNAGPRDLASGLSNDLMKECDPGEPFGQRPVTFWVELRSSPLAAGRYLNHDR